MTCIVYDVYYIYYRNRSIHRQVVFVKIGKVTLPLILAYLRSNSQEKKFWKRTIQNLQQDKDDFNIALNIINKYNCLNDTIERAIHFANIAKDSLGIFKDTIYKQVLINLIDSSISRIY